MPSKLLTLFSWFFFAITFVSSFFLIQKRVFNRKLKKKSWKKKRIFYLVQLASFKTCFQFINAGSRIRSATCIDFIHMNVLKSRTINVVFVVFLCNNLCLKLFFFFSIRRGSKVRQHVEERKEKDFLLSTIGFL